MSSTKKLINAQVQVVNEAVEGLLLCNSSLARVGSMNVVVRADVEVYKQDHVTLISGGGSGHEPAHAGYIGNGMLTAAVLGNVFASPSVSQILAAIRVCAGPKGVLLIVKNYTGDRLNFGMALEKAKCEGLLVKMVVVGDDVALEKGKGITGGRGIAGTVLVHKIAGAGAAAGLSLEQVHQEASSVLPCLGSLGIGLTTCTVPGAPPSTRLDEPALYEVGLGIHGEPGREQRSLDQGGGGNNADTIAKILVEGVLARIVLSSSEQPLVVIMVNNLGALPAIEMAIVARGIVRELGAKGVGVLRAYVGTFMTALEMAGVSLTILSLNGEAATATTTTTQQLLARLDADTSSAAWLAAGATSLSLTPSICVLPYSDLPSETAGAIGGGVPCPLAAIVATAICESIIEKETELTRFDMICGDGDCGLVMKAGASKVLADMAASAGSSCSYTLHDSALFCDSLATSISASMGGTSGALLEICFRSMAQSLSASSSSSPSPSSLESVKQWTMALRKGVDAICFYGGASEGMRTMLDALLPAIASLEAAEDGASMNERLAKAVEAAQQGVKSTLNVQALAGRANYVNAELMKGVPDPGAVAVAVAFEAAAKSLLEA